MNRPGKKPPAFRPPLNGGVNSKSPPTGPPTRLPTMPPRTPMTNSPAANSPAQASPVAGLSLGTRIGLGLAIGLFASLSIVVAGALAAKLLRRDTNAVAGIDARPPVSQQSPVLQQSPAPEQPRLEPTDPMASLTAKQSGSLQDVESEAKQEPRPMPAQSDPTAMSQPASASAKDANDLQSPEQQSPTTERKPVAEEALIWVRSLQGRTLALPTQSGLVLSHRETKLAIPSGEQKLRVAGSTPTASSISLKLLGVDVVYGQGDAVTLDQSQEAAEEHADASNLFLREQTWLVHAKANDENDQPTELGRFSIHNNSLSFQWHRHGARSNAASKLRYCMIEISVGRAGDGERVVCRLSDPQVLKMQSVNLLEPESKIELSSLRVTELPPERQLQIAVTLQGFPSHQVDEDNELEVDEVLKTAFVFDDQTEPNEPGMVLATRFELARHPAVHFDVAAFPNRLFEELADLPEVDFDSDEARKFKKRLSDRISKLKKEERDLRVEKRVLEVNLLRVKAQSSNRTELRKQEAAIAQRLTQVESGLEQNTKELQLLDLEKQWRDRLAKELSTGQIGLKLFIKIGEREVVIAASEGEGSEAE